jgi:WhiB family redox-sensing transcriptional regulator
MLPELSLTLATTDTSTTPSVTAPPKWPGTAACAEVDPELFFPLDEDGDSAQPAKTICAGCEVQELCLAYAVSTGMAAGVWGGMSTSQRHDLVRARRAESRRGAR